MHNLQLETMERRLLLNEEKDDVENGEDDDDSNSYENAVEATGYGWWQYWLITVGGLANASDAIEILCVSILLPAAQCDLSMSSQDKGLLSAMVFFGMMVGGYIWGCLGDIYGRRNVLIVSLFVNAIAGIVSSVAQGFILFLILRFISGLGVGGSIPLVWTYISEFQPKDKRGGALSVVASFWMIGNIAVAGLALAIIPINMHYSSGSFTFNSWRLFLLICAIPSLAIGIVLFWYPESPMFLLKKGRNAEALEILRNVYAKNTDKRASSFPIKYLKSSDHKSVGSNVYSSSWWSSVVHAVKETWRQTNALFGRGLLRVTIIMLIVNFTIQFGYYGLWLWFPELFNRLEQYYNEHPDDKVSICELTAYQSPNASVPVTDPCDDIDYQPLDTAAIVNSLILAVAPLPFNIWTIFYMDRLGRKFFLVFSMVLSGLSAFGIYLVKSSLDNLILGCLFGAVSTMGFNALDCLGVELFPTHLRSTALAVTLLFARLGSICGQFAFGLLLDTYCWVPITMVATLLIGGGILSIILPNTTRTALE